MKYCTHGDFINLLIDEKSPSYPIEMRLEAHQQVYGLPAIVYLDSGDARRLGNKLIVMAEESEKIENRPSCAMPGEVGEDWASERFTARNK